jgi:hypothetical protein
VLHGTLHRPFSLAAGVSNRGYSFPLQRCLTDFGADDSFSHAARKVREHYGVDVPTSAVQRITEHHADQMRGQECLLDEFPDGAGAAYVIVEADGSMIPLVETAKVTADQPSDGRRRRKVKWQEARLALAHQLGSVTPVFGVTMGGVDDAGDQMLNCAIRAGGCSQSTIHCVGDGARWLADQTARVYADQGSYLVDFFHLSDYLAAAATRCCPDDPTKWRKEAQLLVKTGQISKVHDDLELHLEPQTTADKDAPVRCCHRYIRNRPGQFAYDKAIAAGLPIGSGEIESAHRYVVQKRLKIAGAWWLEENARKMLALRTLRENSGWEKYWERHNSLWAA